jgi:hypothetical protein
LWKEYIMQAKTKMYLTACALALTGLVGTASFDAAFARGAGGGGGAGAGLGIGGGHAGGASAGHASAQGSANSNGPNAADHDTGQARAEDRRSAQGAAHSQADLHAKNAGPDADEPATTTTTTASTAH